VHQPLVEPALDALPDEAQNPAAHPDPDGTRGDAEGTAPRA
jgi:hypothetical protein